MQPDSEIMCKLRNFPVRRVLALTLLAALLPANVAAGPILSSDGFTGPWDIVAQARNGRTGWEAALWSPDNLPAYMNPFGAPVWSYGNPYPFQLQYFYASGTTVWSIDFNRDGDFLDAQESVTGESSSLVGRSFRYLNLFIQGSNQNNALATAQNLTINGVPFGTFTADQNVAQFLFTDTRGLFGNLDVRGSLIFSADGRSDERPRLWLRLGWAETFREYSEVPEPSTLALVGAGLLAAGIFRRRSRRAR